MKIPFDYMIRVLKHIMVIHRGVSFTEAFLFSNAAFCSIWTCLIQKTISPHWLSSVGFFILPLMTWTRAWSKWWLAYGHWKYGCASLVPSVHGHKTMFLLLQPDSQSTEDNRSLIHAVQRDLDYPSYYSCMDPLVLLQQNCPGNWQKSCLQERQQDLTSRKHLPFLS